MKKDPNDIKDDEIRIIRQKNPSSESEGKQEKDSDNHGKKKRIRKKMWIATSVLIILVTVVWSISSVFPTTSDTENDSNNPSYGQWIKANDSYLPTTSLKKSEIISIFEPASSILDLLSAQDTTGTARLSQLADTTACGVEIQDTCVNDVPLRIYIPHGARPELYIGLPDPEDSTIIYAVQAADVRRDNGKIIGTFVLRGEPVAWGESKAGFCAIIDGEITLGTAASTSYFEKATETGGDFFRQYSIVHEGHPVENKPKNKAIRRALCEKAGEIFVIESCDRESFHDFTQAVADLGIQEAIYLIGGSAYGWVTDMQQQKTTFGTPMRNRKYAINYLLWKKKSGTP